MARIRLGPKTLKRILEANDEEYYGVAGQVLHCPIARALEEKGARLPSVTGLWIDYWKDGERIAYSTPPWAKRFISDVDHHVRERHGPVLRTYAFAVLEEIIEEKE
jgi:hypothetical protein